MIEHYSMEHFQSCTVPRRSNSFRTFWRWARRATLYWDFEWLSLKWIHIGRHRQNSTVVQNSETFIGKRSNDYKNTNWWNTYPTSRDRWDWVHCISIFSEQFMYVRFTLLAHSSTGSADGRFSPSNCFWLNDEMRKGSAHLFRDDEIEKSNNKLELSEMLLLRKFIIELKPSKPPSFDDVKKIENIMRRLKSGIHWRYTFSFHTFVGKIINVVPTLRRHRWQFFQQ